MAELARVDINPIVAQVKTVLEGFPEVAGAYLFGSILGDCRPDSDIDLGLILEAGINPDSLEGDRLEAGIALLLPPFEGHAFDIALVNQSKPIFAFRVISEGKLIYVKNRERVTDVMEYVSRKYADLYPRYRAALEEIFAEVVSSGLRS